MVRSASPRPRQLARPNPLTSPDAIVGFSAPPQIGPSRPNRARWADPDPPPLSRGGGGGGRAAPSPQNSRQRREVWGYATPPPRRPAARRGGLCVYAGQRAASAWPGGGRAGRGGAKSTELPPTGRSVGLRDPTARPIGRPPRRDARSRRSAGRVGLAGRGPGWAGRRQVHRTPANGEKCGVARHRHRAARRPAAAGSAFAQVSGPRRLGRAGDAAGGRRQVHRTPANGEKCGVTRPRHRGVRPPAAAGSASTQVSGPRRLGRAGAGLGGAAPSPQNSRRRGEVWGCATPPPGQPAASRGGLRVSAGQRGVGR
jgi:hypothetical protein